ncbi:Olfactomedin-like protein 2B [Labeo rohita]|uniref:Olfactomedin-like protein 2B n=1 Tax=Labeo rohita TaxID=84645 RepID=A0ABQ8MXD4_LABRO|nr:Olfactomedin-like protein 2B [Labeo rohita]
MDNQENILTQLIGDYDKVKTLSEGPDCKCKCVVRPLSRSACKRIEEGQAKAEDFYTVETITTGPNCKKCACVAPPSALNPCEGDFRFKKLQEAGRDDIKLSTITDLLEGAFYGMDLLKLHSITTKLLERVDNIEKSFSGSHTKEKVSVKGEKAQVKGPRSNQRQEKKKRLSALEPSLQKNTAAAFAHIATAAHEVVSGDGSVDLIIEDQIHKQELPASVTTPGTTVAVTQTPPVNLTTQNGHPTAANTPNVTQQTKEETVEAKKSITITTAKAILPTSMPLTTTVSPSTTATTIKTPLAVPHLAGVTAPAKKSKLSWDEATTQTSTQPPKKTKEQGICKDTLASIADPVTHNKYGKNEGAWMKDPKGNGKVIYVTDNYYGNQLLEFRDLDTFKQGQFSNSYKLPYNWFGTGHVVYGGSFFYNRAFSRDIIRFDLRLRYVAAWTTLHDAVLEEEEAPWSWGGHSDIDFGVDESGLWIVYPALDEEGFHQEVIILSKLRPSDLQKEKNWRTGLRRNYYGNCFIICGVLYAVDSFERTHANISYAFDTHTHTQMIPRLPFLNNYTYTTQIDYNPKERMLYAWDNGHQVTYDVIFAY